MTKEEIRREIMDSVIQPELESMDYSKENIPVRYIGYEPKDTQKSGALENFRMREATSSFAALYENLGKAMDKNGILQSNRDMSDEKITLTRATAFVSAVLGSVYMKDKLRDSIDEFFDAPDNADYFKDMSDDEKFQFRNELKDEASAAVKHQASSKEGRNIVDKIDRQFSNLVQHKDRSDAKSLQAQLEKFHYTENFIGCGMSALIALNEGLTRNEYDTKTIGNVVKSKISAESSKDWFANEHAKFFSELVDDVLANSKALAKEEMLETSIMKLNVSADKTARVKPQDFVRSIESARALRPNDPDAVSYAPEAEWANELYEGNFSDRKFEDFMIDGKPMFTKAQISGLTDSTKKIEVIAAALSGKAVMFQNAKEGEMTLVNPVLTKSIEREPKKTWWQAFVDFIKDLFGSGSKEKQLSQQKLDEMQNAYDKNRADFNNKKYIKEKISLNELMGKKTAEKLSTAISKDLAKTKKDPSLGM